VNVLRRLAARMTVVESEETDPDQVVWVATVALWQAPLVVHALDEADIRATFAESASRRAVIGGMPAARLYVLQAHRAAAERIILDVTGTGSAP
jgi:hypothetical protein